MKKYIITENQFEKLVNKLDERVEFEDLPDIKSSDPKKTDAEYTKEIEPLSFQEFLAKDNDIKANVTANVSANRASASIDKVEDNLLAIAGKHHKGIYSNLKYDDNVLGVAEDLSLIILTIAYFIDNKKYSDVKIKYERNLDFLNKKNLQGILGNDSFKNTNVTIQINPNDPNDVKLNTDNDTVVAHVNKENPPKTKKIEFNNISGSTIDKIIDYFKNKANVDYVNRVLPKKFTDIKKSGRQIIVTF
jgi:hypothetical protein